MPENANQQDMEKNGPPSLKQFRANFKEIFDSETTFGSAKAARMELLDSVKDIISEYVEKGCKMVFIHGRLKEAGYPGSRKELGEWLVANDLWTKREMEEKSPEAVPDLSENEDSKKSDPETPGATTSVKTDAADKKSGPPLSSPGGIKVISVHPANSRQGS